MRKSKITALTLTLILTLGSFSICKASVNNISNLDKPYNVYSVEIPTSVSNFAKSKFQILLESARQDPDSYGLPKEIIDKLYIGSGFNIFEEGSNSPKNQNIYYYTVMYNDKIMAIFTVGIDPNGDIYATLGKDFAGELQDIFEKHNDGSSFVLISSDNNIYAQNKSGSYPVFVYQEDKTANLKNVSYEKHIKDVKKAFNTNDKLNIKKKSDTIARESILNSKATSLNSQSSLSSMALSTSLSSKWLQVPKINQMDSNNVKRGMCWAAATASILDYKLNCNLSATTICDISQKSYNIGGSIYDARNAMVYYGVYSSRAITGILNDTTIESYINNNTPIYMESRGGSSLAHSTVLRGYMVGSGYIDISIMNPNTAQYEAAYRVGSSYNYSMGNVTYTWTQTVVYN